MTRRGRGLAFGTLLTALTVGLVLLAVAGVAVPAAGLLRALAENQALARARFAALSAERELLDRAAALEVSARLLAERPTLGRLAAEGDRKGLEAFLEGYYSGALNLANTVPIVNFSKWQEPPTFY